MIIFPATEMNCFGLPPPTREPLPPARITAIFMYYGDNLYKIIIFILKTERFYIIFINFAPVFKLYVLIER